MFDSQGRVFKSHSKIGLMFLQGNERSYAKFSPKYKARNKSKRPATSMSPPT